MKAAPPRRTAALRGMDGLRELQRTLQSLEREAQAETAARRERERREQLERELFARSVGPVWPLRAGARAELARERPAPLPLQRLRDEQAVMREALSDDFDVESLLDTDEALSWRRSEIGAEVVRKLRRGVWATQAQVDLHGLRRDEARERLADFLREAGKHGLRCVRVVHGKGHGSPGRQAVLKGKVKSWLVQKAEVLAFVQARASEGGAGALIVLLATRVVGAATSAPADSRASRR